MKSAATAARTGSASSIARARVRDLLGSSSAYASLPAERKSQIANDTVRVASYLADPHGLLAAEFREPLLADLVAARGRRSRRNAKLTMADTIRMSPAAMDELVQAVDFPDFVNNLIDGVFSAIVNASVRQMEAYADLIAAVAKSVDEFVAREISDAAGRDALVSEFPDVFCWSDAAARRLRFHAQPAASGLQRVASTIGLRETTMDRRAPRELSRIIAAARRRIARNRQQLFATTVLLGINRIVVTNSAPRKSNASGVRRGGRSA